MDQQQKCLINLWDPYEGKYTSHMDPMGHDILTLRIQICPKKGSTPAFLFKGWDWNPQSYSREGSGFLG